MQASPRSSLDVLTSIRGIAASMVVIYHAQTGWNPVFALGQGYSMIVASGWLWVSFFFVLSGFVMMFAYSQTLARWNTAAYRRFVIARFGRIYPLFLFTLVVMLVAVAAGAIERQDPWWTLVPNLLLVQGYVLGQPGWNGPAWSISTEWAVYLAFPFFVPFLVGLGQRATLVCTVAFAIAVARLFIIDTNAKVVPFDRLAGCALEFALGCCVHRLVHESWWPRVGERPALLLCVLPVLLMALPGQLFTTTTTAVVAVAFAVSIAVIARQETELHRMLRVPALQFLGRISYSLYLNHGVLYLLAAALIDGLVGRTAVMMNAPGWVALLLFPVYLAVLVVVSDLTYRLIEEPARRAFRRFSGYARHAEPQPSGALPSEI